MDALTVATLNLEDGTAVDLLPDLAAQAGQIDLLLFQAPARPGSGRKL